MDGQKAAAEGYKIICKKYPSEFITNKNAAKAYFRQFGKFKRLTFKPSLKICTVEYATRDGYLNALNNCGEYNGNTFEVYSEKSPGSKKKTMTHLNPIYLDDKEVDTELAAMRGFATTTYGLSESFSEIPKSDKVPKLKRTWPSETPPKLKTITKSKEKSQIVQLEELSKHTELITLIKSQAVTVEERYKVLDARDKLIRIKLKKKTNIKSSPTVGTCPDMCPEKERLMRETQHQVALYEQEENGRLMDQTKAIKQYSRSSADQETPLPHELRPVSVLQMTMCYLMHNIMDLCESNEVNLAEWYHFLWDRTRGIRKDITQQELCGQGAVELIEQCARFHIHCSARLVAEDPSVFDQKINTENLTKCLQSLKYMYHDLQLKGEQCPNEPEFRAYIILLNLNDGNFMWEVQQLKTEIQKSKEVKFALEVYSALDQNNYVKFFKLVNSTTYLNACILMRYFIQVRITAIKTLLKCYTSRAFRTVYPLAELKHFLAFDDVESTVDFLQAYGLSLTEDNAYVVLDKNNFIVPEMPYLLDRSLNVVEVKRFASVGKIVCGRELPPKMFEKHIPQNSFDENGWLILNDLLKEVDLDQEELLKEDAVVSISSNISTIKTVESTNVTNIFSQNSTGTRILSAQDSNESFSKEADLETRKQPPIGFFSQMFELKKSILSTASNSESLSSFSNFDHEESNSLSKDVTDSSYIPISSTFKIPQTSLGVFSEPFSGTSKLKTTEGVKNVSKIGDSKRGGFYFELPQKTEEIKTSNTIKGLESHSNFLLENVKAFKEKKEQEKLEKLQLETETKRKQAELEEKRQEEKKRQEIELRELKKRKQEQELIKQLEELRREEERVKNVEIQDTVRSVLTTIVKKVSNKLHQDQLDEIIHKNQQRLLREVVKKWRQIVVRNKRKRKAFDCSPVWINTKTVEQSAKELQTTSQDLTLRLRKRYRYGKSLDIQVDEPEKIEKINLFQLTHAILNRRFFHLKGTLDKNIFWKVEISVPDHYELNNGLSRIEDTLKDVFQWRERNGTIIAIEQVKPNAMQSVTYCIERQRGLYVRNNDANGIIFIAKDFNALLRRRILENLKNLGVFTRIPIVIILQEHNDEKCKLHSLIEENIVSDYVILIENLTQGNLVELVQEGLIYLANKVEKPPPLELDTFEAFLKKYLCTELWKRANSFAKWNSHYKSCLRDPNVVINLYNEAVSKLKRIVLNKSCFEYPTFPEVFKDYLQSEIPDYLPCNYRYFPNFWKNDAYFSMLEELFENLPLPNWSEKWPPRTELELEVNVSKYCTSVYNEPEKPFYKVMSVLLQDIDPNVNFEDIKKIMWTGVIEVLALEKLRQTDFSLCGTTFETKSIFNQFVVVYDVNTLVDYNKSDWFYIGHPLIKKRVQDLMRHEEVKTNENVKFDTTICQSDLDETFKKAEALLKGKQDYLQLRKELEEFDYAMRDLEESLTIHKKISSKIETNLQEAIANN